MKLNNKKIFSFLIIGLLIQISIIQLIKSDELIIKSAQTLSETGITRVYLQQGLEKLPEHYREILLLRFAEGRKFQEIADLQEKSLDATKSLFRRAISAMRDQLGGQNA